MGRHDTTTWECHRDILHCEEERDEDDALARLDVSSLSANGMYYIVAHTLYFASSFTMAHLTIK